VLFIIFLCQSVRQVQRCRLHLLTEVTKLVALCQCARTAAQTAVNTSVTMTQCIGTKVFSIGLWANTVVAHAMMHEKIPPLINDDWCY